MVWPRGRPAFAEAPRNERAFRAGVVMARVLRALVLGVLVSLSSPSLVQYLPLVRQPPRRAVAAISAVASGAASKPPANAIAPTTQQLVLVEESDALRHALRQVLVKQGFTCHAFSDGSRALQALMHDGLEADLIITDVLLAGVDGYTLLQRVRTDARLCTVPVVVLSSKGLTSDRIAGFNAGASAYVSKPFDVQELLAVVRQLLAASLATQRQSMVRELDDVRRDIASVKRLLQMLLQVQAQNQLGAPANGQGYAAADAAAAAAVGGGIRLPAASAATEGGGTSALALVQTADLAAGAGGGRAVEEVKLTRRERTVLERVGEGMLNKEIAADLGVSKSHVEKYVRRLFGKTRTTNRTELVRRALQLGLLSDDPMGEARRKPAPRKPTLAPPPDTAEPPLPGATPLPPMPRARSAEGTG